MDDFILLFKTKEECVIKKQQIEIFLKEVLHLELNAKSRYYPYKMGIDFCGYRTFTTHRLLRNNSKKKIKRKIKFWNKLYKNKKLNFTKTLNSLNAWKGHSSHCNSYHLQQKLYNSCDFIYNPNSINLIENNENYSKNAK